MWKKNRNLILCFALLLILAKAGALQAKDYVRVLPLKTQIVKVSNKHVNWLRCMTGKVGDLTFSKEKGIDAWIEGNSAFVKYLLLKTHEGPKYSNVNLDIYVPCGGEVYKLILEPDSKMKKGQTIHMGSSEFKHLKKNRSLFKGKPLEEAALRMIKAAYVGDFSDGYNVSKVKANPVIIDNMELIGIREISLLGTGLVLKEYQLYNPLNQTKEIILKKLATKRISSKPVAMTADPLLVAPKEKARIFIVQRSKQRLPTLFKESVK